MRSQDFDPAGRADSQRDCRSRAAFERFEHIESFIKALPIAGQTTPQGRSAIALEFFQDGRAQPCRIPLAASRVFYDLLGESPHHEAGLSANVTGTATRG
jgi:hypothetical protein